MGSGSVAIAGKSRGDRRRSARCFFANTDTEAMEGGLKMVRSHGHPLYPEKYEVITLENSFHGRTFGALSITGQAKYRQDFGPLVGGARFATLALALVAGAQSGAQTGAQTNPAGQMGGAPGTSR